jgi:hypothetical protein
VAGNGPQSGSQGCLWCGGSRQPLVVRIHLLDTGTSARVDCRIGSIIIIVGFFGIGSGWRDEWRWRWLIIRIRLLGVSVQLAVIRPGSPSVTPLSILTLPNSEPLLQ